MLSFASVLASCKAPGTPTISCVYPLNADNTQVVTRMGPLGVTEKGNVVSQTLSITFQDPGVGTFSSDVGAMNALETTFSPIVDARAFEVEIPSIPVGLSLNSSLFARVYVYPVSADIDTFIRQLICRKLGGNVDFDSFGNPALRSLRIGFLFDPNYGASGGWQYIRDNVIVGGVEDGGLPFSDLAIALRLTVETSDNADTGALLQMNLISNGADLVYNYPVGTKDICGNTI